MAATTDRLRVRDARLLEPSALPRRRDRWWLQPAITVLVLGGFVAYGLYVTFVNADYYADPYLSPFYSPCLAANCEHQSVKLIGDWWTLSPALLILPFPLGFRLTCYYYRKAYYRSFFLSPPACTIPDVGKKYKGESRFPLILQNVHRLFFYLVLPFPFILLWDGIQAFDFPDGTHMGVGTLILLANAVLLGAYTLSCHTCRHLCGGRIDVMSSKPTRYRAWRVVTFLNERHMQIAWVSLVGVAFTDLYIRLVANDVFHDPRIF
ncbi:MAG: hypothetical protein WD598_06215 [Acidimicrobiia bacterium]